MHSHALSREERDGILVISACAQSIRALRVKQRSAKKHTRSWQSRVGMSESGGKGWGCYFTGMPPAPLLSRQILGGRVTTTLSSKLLSLCILLFAPLLVAARPEVSNFRSLVEAANATNTPRAPPSPPSQCRHDICGDSGNDCCAPNAEPRVCTLTGYAVV